MLVMSGVNSRQAGITCAASTYCRLERVSSPPAAVCTRWPAFHRGRNSRRETSVDSPLTEIDVQHNLWHRAIAGLRQTGTGTETETEIGHTYLLLLQGHGKKQTLIFLRATTAGETVDVENMMTATGTGIVETTTETGTEETGEDATEIGVVIGHLREDVSHQTETVVSMIETEGLPEECRLWAEVHPIVAPLEVLLVDVLALPLEVDIGLEVPFVSSLSLTLQKTTFQITEPKKPRTSAAYRSPQLLERDGSQHPPEEGQITAEDKPVTPAPEDIKKSPERQAMEVEKASEAQKPEISNTHSPKREPLSATSEIHAMPVDPSPAPETPQQAFRSPLPPPLDQKKEESEAKMAVDPPSIPIQPRSHPIPYRPPARSPSPQPTRSSTTTDSSRVLPTGPRRGGWAPRSPGGPRNHPTRSGPPPHSFAPRAPPARRGHHTEERGFPRDSTYRDSRDPIRDHTRDHTSYKKGGIKIPEFNPSKQWADLEKDLARQQTHRTNAASDHLQQMKGLHRALHELDLSSIDLHAAESRRRIAESQMEKAKTGSLGIDAAELVDPQSV
ncbi:unnamed protein product [Cyclocybe aegerita]|uniref:Uncharacterized protein n=1 Tax=Cyclocybe aegerita TaxID=1973307 RepID=A0A8S0XXP0_CYCAE|nr:unnamed protein product [Cyclocybe aegerita]